MSARESLTAARTALEMIASVSSEPVVQRLAMTALETVLRVASAETPGARRQREYRQRHALRNGDVTGRNGSVTPHNVTLGGEGGGVFSEIQEDQDPIKRDLGGAGGVTSRDVTRDAPTTRKVTNAADDGAFGSTVGAWCEGIALVTGQPCPLPSIGAVRQLVTILGVHRPADAEAVAWSREVAKAYAEANRGRVLSPFAFGDWLASGKPSRPSPSPHDAPGHAGKVAETPEAVQARERAQAAEHERLRREAVPAPPGFATLLGKIGGPARKVVATTTNGVGRHVGPSSPHPPVGVRQELTDDEREERRRESLRRASEFAETLSASEPEKA